MLIHWAIETDYMAQAHHLEAAQYANHLAKKSAFLGRNRLVHGVLWHQPEPVVRGGEAGAVPPGSFVPMTVCGSRLCTAGR